MSVWPMMTESTSQNLSGYHAGSAGAVTLLGAGQERHVNGQSDDLAGVLRARSGMTNPIKA